MAKQKKGISSPTLLELDLRDEGNSIRTRNGRRQPTPPLIINTEPEKEQPSGVSRVNKEIATLIARKDPVLNRVVKKPKDLTVKAEEASVWRRK